MKFGPAQLGHQGNMPDIFSFKKNLTGGLGDVITKNCLRTDMWMDVQTYGWGDAGQSPMWDKL